jgi:hypothetical protein
VGEKVHLTNRITSALKNYYLQVLDWFEDKDTQVFCEFLQRYPTLKAAQAATKSELTLKIDQCFTALPNSNWFAALPDARSEST